LFSPDPFADAAKGDEEGVQDGLVHIRIQQRNGRKTLTTIQGLSKEYDLKKIVKSCKKVKIKKEFVVVFKTF
jgi:translation initiation factor 1